MNPSEYIQQAGAFKPAPTGMTLRDYFAARAMQGVVIALGTDLTCIHMPNLSHWAYQMADAMLAERDRSRVA